MASQRDSKKKQQDFFANMQTVANDLASVTEDLRSAAHMLQQNAQAQPTYGGPNGSRPVFNGDGTHRPQSHRDYSLDQGYAGYGALRRSVASEAAARYGSTGGLFERGNTYAPRYDRNGQIKSYDELDPHGVVVGTHGRADTEAQQGYARQQRAQGYAQAMNAPSPFFTGAGNGPVHTPGVSTVQHVLNSTVGKLGPIGGIIAGGLGAIIGAPDAIMNGIVNQRAKNAQYQSILGGTNWSTGTHNRWLEEGFKLSQLYSGGLTGSQSVEAFRSVTGLGYTGDARDKSLGLITSNYKNLGMSVGDSLKFVGLMAQSSSTSFENLKTILNQVGDSAKNTGQNLELARTNLANLFGIATTVLGGPGALQTSGMVGNYSLQLGRNFAGVDFSQMLPGANPGLTALQASSVGMSMSQYELTQAGGGSGARALQEQAGDKLLAMSTIPDVGLVQPIINQLMQKHGGLKAVTASNDSWQSFVQNVMRDPSFIKSGLNIMALKKRIKAYTGADMNDQQAIEWLLRQTTGVGASFKGMDQQQQNAMKQKSRGTYAKEKMDPTSADYVQLSAYQHGGSTKEVWDRYAKDHHLQVRGGEIYKEQSRDPMLDKFKKFASGEHHVVVQTKDGPKVVTGKYAMDHFKDQIAKGTAKFIGGSDGMDGQTVAEALGGGYAESNYKGTNTTKVSGGDKHHFQSVAEYEKHAQKTNGNGGKVIIAPNPALAQLLNITATGNVTVANEGARFGAVPKPGQVGPN